MFKACTTDVQARVQQISFHRSTSPCTTRGCGETAASVHLAPCCHRGMPTDRMLQRLQAKARTRFTTMIRVSTTWSFVSTHCRFLADVQAFETASVQQSGLVTLVLWSSFPVFGQCTCSNHNLSTSGLRDLWRRQSPSLALSRSGDWFCKHRTGSDSSWTALPESG